VIPGTSIPLVASELIEDRICESKSQVYV